MRPPLCPRLYWVGDETLGTDNIVAANRQKHEESSSPLPRFLVAFYNDGMATKSALTQGAALEMESIRFCFGTTSCGQMRICLLLSEHQSTASRLEWLRPHFLTG